MTNSRTRASYAALSKRINEKLRDAIKILKKLGYESQHVSPKEFYDYMTGETPTGDTITIIDVLDNDFLTVHEIVEISELKKIGIPIGRRTIIMFHPKVYEAHFTATEYELDYALDKKDYDWLRVRINHARSWLEDDCLPKHLVLRCRAILKKFSEGLLKEE